MKNFDSFILEEEDLSVDKIFKCIVKRNTEALMLHDKLCTYFNFLGLDGFSKYHEYRYFEESRNRIDTKKYYMKKYGKIIIDKDIDDVSIIPNDWEKYLKEEVQSQNKPKYIENAFKIFKNWEIETKEKYTKFAKWIFENGCLVDFEYILCLIDETDCEIEFAEKMIYKMKNMNYNIEYVDSFQHMLCKKIR